MPNEIIEFPYCSNLKSIIDGFRRQEEMLLEKMLKIFAIDETLLKGDGNDSKTEALIR